MLFDKTTTPTVLRASATLTGARVASTELDVATWSHVTVEVTYTVGTGGTSPALELEPQVLGADGTTWLPAQTALTPGTPATGQVALACATPLYTRDAAGSFVLTIPVLGHARFRVRVRETGGPSPYGTCAVSAYRARAAGLA